MTDFRSHRRIYVAFLLVYLCAFAAGRAGADRVDQLIGDLNSRDANIRLSSARELSHTKDRRAVKPLIAAPKDSDPNVRRTVVDALGEIKDGRAVKPLIAVGEGARSDAQDHAADALGNISVPDFPIPDIKPAVPDAARPFGAAFTIIDPSPSLALHNLLWYSAMTPLDQGNQIPVVALNQFLLGRQRSEIPPNGTGRHECRETGALKQQGTYTVSITLTFETTWTSGSGPRVFERNLKAPSLVWHVGHDEGQWLDRGAAAATKSDQPLPLVRQLPSG